MKKNVSDLALFGGKAAFPEKFHVGRPGVPVREARDRLFERFNGALDRKWLSNHGPLMEEFEAEIARVTGVRHAIAVCNATVGMQIAARACGLSGEIIVPAFTFVASAHAMEWIGLKPVFADVCPDTHGLDPASVEKLITPQTSAILGVHLWGFPCRIGQLETIAARYGLLVLYDASHAFGCSHQGKMIGGNGRAEIFSFHATKFVQSGEGGAVTTNDDELARRIRSMSSFGFVEIDRVIDAGTNGKMSEIAAAMGLTSLESMEKNARANRNNFAAYANGLEGIGGLRLLHHRDCESHNYHYAVIEIDAGQVGLSRNQLMDILWAEGVLARRYFYPGCHRMQPYTSQGAENERTLPVAEKLAGSVLALPTGPTMLPIEVSRICDIIRFSIRHADDIAMHQALQPVQQAENHRLPAIPPVAQTGFDFGQESRP